MTTDICTDIYDDTKGALEFESDEEKNTRSIVARVATLDVRNRNNRILPKGIVGDNVIHVAMSEWEHNSIKPQGGPFSGSGTRMPVAQAELYEKDGHLWARTKFDMSYDHDIDVFRRLRGLKDVIGFSVGYAPVKQDKVDIPGSKLRASLVTEARFVEFTPTMIPASPNTKITAIDSINVERLTDHEIDELLDQIPATRLLEAAHKQNKRNKELLHGMKALLDTYRKG